MDVVEENERLRSKPCLLADGIVFTEPGGVVLDFAELTENETERSDSPGTISG